MMNWFWHIIFGAILLAGGVGVTSLGWHFINEWNRVGLHVPTKKEKRKKCFHVICVLLGLLSIIVGGPWTTFGWNQWDNHRQKQALIVACIREWKFNDRLLPFCYFTVKDKAKLSERYPYPLFQTNSTQATCTSALFNPNLPEDLKLLIELKKYELNTIGMQCRLYRTDQRLNLVRSFKALDEHQKVNDSDDVKLFLESHNELGKLFIKDYCWAWEKALRILPASIKEDQIEPNKPEDNKEGEVVKNKPEDNKK